MEQAQVEKYEFCKKHLEKIKSWRTGIPIKQQAYGCGSQRPPIEHKLQKIHNEMYSKIFEALQKAEDEVQGIITKI